MSWQAGVDSEGVLLRRGIRSDILCLLVGTVLADQGCVVHEDLGGPRWSLALAKGTGQGDSARPWEWVAAALSGVGREELLFFLLSFNYALLPTQALLLSFNLKLYY